ncbi:MAG: hypothetical protein ACLRQ0_06950 [Monoglobales bacterium]
MKKKYAVPLIEILMFDDEDITLGPSSPDDGEGRLDESEFNKENAGISVTITAPEVSN